MQKQVRKYSEHPFEQYFAKKKDKIADEAVRLLDTDLKNGTADVYLLSDNVCAVSPVGKTYNLLADSWDSQMPDNPPMWFDDREIWRESDKKMPRGYRLTPSLSDVMMQKTLYYLKPVAEVAFNKRIKIENSEHLNNALKFAAQLPEESQSSLGWSFNSLKNLIENAKEGYMLHVSPDFVDHSFYFWIEKDDKMAFNGGIILHGLQERLQLSLLHRNIYTGRCILEE